MPPKRKVSGKALEEDKEAAAQPAPKLGAKPKRLLSKQTYPQFEDADTIISLSSDHANDLTLFKSDLIRLSGYFATIEQEGWPQRFVLEARDDIGNCRVIPVRGSRVSTLHLYSTDPRPSVENSRRGTA